MRREKAKAGLLGLLGGMVVFLLPAPSWAAQIQVGSAGALPGETVTIGAALVSGPAEQIAAVSLEVRFDSARLNLPTCTIDPRIGPGSGANKSLFWSLPEAGLLRVGIVGINRTVISSGPLFSCDLVVDSAAPGGEASLASSAQAARANGASAAITAASGAVQIDPDPDGDGRPFTGLADACRGGQTTGCEDNCPFVANASQDDTDGNGVGNACECGDISGDGRLSALDSRLIQSCAAGLIGDPELCLHLCDVTGDGRCTTVDAGLIQRAVVGLITRDALVCSEQSFHP